jgi:hypothetical protein
VSHLISSDDLSRWLRDVDAGELDMIIDSCFSASAAETPTFKPGPMGSRGLGQLSYDKGMRILAATQANDVALESSKLGLSTMFLRTQPFVVVQIEIPGMRNHENPGKTQA